MQDSKSRAGWLFQQMHRHRLDFRFLHQYQVGGIGERDVAVFAGDAHLVQFRAAFFIDDGEDIGAAAFIDDEYLADVRGMFRDKVTVQRFQPAQVKHAKLLARFFFDPPHAMTSARRCRS